MYTTKDAHALCSKVCQGGAPSQKHVPSPAQSQELLPAVVLEPAALGTAGMDQQGLPDLRSIPLEHKFKKKKKKSVPSSKVSLSAPAGEGRRWLRRGPDRQWLSAAACSSKAGQQAVKSCNGLFKVHSNMSNNAEWLGQSHTMDILLTFSPQISLTRRRL